MNSVNGHEIPSSLSAAAPSPEEVGWWKIPGSPPDAARFSQSCEELFLSRNGVLGLQRILETLAVHQDEALLSLSGAILVLRHSVRYDIVDLLLKNVLRLLPDNVVAHCFTAHLCIVRGGLAEGCAHFATLMSRYPGQRIEIGEFVSMSLLEVGYPAEALNVTMSLLRAGDVSVSLLNNAGCALERLNRSTQALALYEQALKINPHSQEVAFGYACSLIKAGQFARGWPVYFNRALQVSTWQESLRGRQRLRPESDLAGKRVLLFQEQGLGDTLQFIRHASVLVERGAEVSVHVPGSISRLISLSCDNLTVLEPKVMPDLDRFDYVAPIPDLPYLTGMCAVQDIPVNVPYLRASGEDIARFEACLPPGRPRIGLVWAGERRGRSEFALADMRRSISFDDMVAALLPIEADIVNLQFGAARDALKDWRGQSIADPMGDVSDMADTAAIMQNLDLVISVDTSPVHLAGALGRPVWLISRWDACWRWGDEGQGSPWYPTMRIFRSQERSFGPVLQEVGKALRLWVAMWRPRKT
ncbi:tetratricopeptide repeat protein [Asaia spathodeae]|uniref:tetratricopeptide repeat protein n=1 Tax=Asaia spathodeae TaxID=657016 RepID=UPI002FC2C613